jgi:ferredoxin
VYLTGVSFDNLTNKRAAPERITPPWETLVLVCAKCKGARRGPSPREIRKGFKQRLGKKQLRVLESDCMGVCPDDAITVCVSRTLSHSVSVHLIRSDDELDALADSLSPG